MGHEDNIHVFELPSQDQVHLAPSVLLSWGPKYSDLPYKRHISAYPKLQTSLSLINTHKIQCDSTLSQVRFEDSIY